MTLTGLFILSQNLGAFDLMSISIPTGTRVMIITLVIVSKMGSGTYLPAYKKCRIAKISISAMVNTTALIDMAASVIDSAVLPLEIWLIGFDVGPPGQAASIIIPMASSGLRIGMSISSKKPISGNIIV